MYITDYLEQSELLLITKKPCKIVVDLEYYDIDDSLIIDDSEIWVKSLISRIIYDDIEFDLILDYPVELKINKIKKDSDSITLYYDEEDIILEQTMEAQDIGKQINYVQRLLGGKEIARNVDHLLLKLKEVYAPYSSMDLIHLEVLLSNVLRDKNDPSIPARLGKIWDPEMINIKEIVFRSGFLQSLNFENLSKSLTYALIQEKPSPKSILERILTGEIYRIEEEKD